VRKPPKPPPRPIPSAWRTELEDCHRQHVDRLKGYVFLLTKRDLTVTEDIVQETFRAATEAWAQLRDLEPRALAGWLHTVATNKSFDHFRETERERRHQPAVWYQLYQPPQQDTVRLALTEAALEACWKVIERMPHRQHAVALLRWRCGYSYREISRMLGMAEKTVSVHVSSARRMLVDEVGPYLPFDLDEPRGGASS
jgi:RNA polymerase sigma factor (sigma-70 family)